MTDEVMTALQNASDKTGVPLQTLVTMALIESSGNPKAHTGSYYGLMQMGKDAVKEVLKKYPAAKLDITSWEKVKTDVTANALAGAYYVKLNQAALERSKLDVSALHLYLAHQCGTHGLKHLLHNVGIQKEFPATKSQLGNMAGSYIKQSGGGDKVTQKMFYAYWQDKFLKNEDLAVLEMAKKKKSMQVVLPEIRVIDKVIQQLNSRIVQP